MNIKRFALMPLLLLVICPNSFAQISHEELVEVLGIRSWRVPLPKDEKSGWDINIINYEPRRPSDRNAEKLDLQNKALIVVRETGKYTFKFILKQHQATSRGEFEINICPEKRVAGNRCENSYVITWYDIPMPYGDGLRYVIADITGESNKPVKQIILAPSSYRGEDLSKESPSSPWKQLKNGMHPTPATDPLMQLERALASRLVPSDRNKVAATDINAAIIPTPHKRKRRVGG